MADIPKDIREYTENRARKYDAPFSFPDSNKYNVNQHTYPSGVGKSPDLQHYVAFFVNIRGKSKFAASYQTNDVKVSNPTNSRRDDVKLEANKNTVQKFGAVVAGATILGAVAGGVNSSGTLLNRGRESAITGLKTGGIVAAQAAAVVGAVSLSSLLKPDNRSRLKDVITLHLEERPSVKYGINYQDKDIGILGGFLTDNSSISQSFNNTGGELATAFAMNLAKIPSIIPGFGSAGLVGLAELGSKTKTNPFREVFFEGVDYRQFNFRYKFMPKDRTESQAVFNIIKTFKEHMHPELSKGGYFYIYPSEFEIVYYYKNRENPYFNRITQCALTDMTVDYGGEQFASFSDGSPTEVNITLSFRELELLTKDSIREGY
jgi:hypothetical protein